MLSNSNKHPQTRPNAYGFQNFSLYSQKLTQAPASIPFDKTFDEKR